MKNKTPKQIISLYNTLRALIIVLYVAALALLIYITTRLAVVGIIGIVILAISLRTPFMTLEEKLLECVIFDDLDPEKFNELIELGAFKRSVRHRVLAAVSLGDHEKALSIIGEVNKQKKENPVEACNALYRKGYIHFEKGEYDKLPEVVREYNALKKKHTQFAAVLDNFTVFDKYDAFADEDYEYVVDVCDIDLKENNPKKQNYKMTKLNVSFYRAVSLYKLGRTDEAKAAFEEIIEFAPKMYKAKLSKEFIDKIEREKQTP